MKSTLKTCVLTAIIGTFVSLAIIVFAMVLTVSGINPWVELAIGIAIFAAGVVAQIVAAAKDNDSLLCIAIPLDAVGGTMALFAVLSLIGFFTPWL